MVKNKSGNFTGRKKGQKIMSQHPQIVVIMEIFLGGKILGQAGNGLPFPVALDCPVLLGVPWVRGLSNRHN